MIAEHLGVAGDISLAELTKMPLPRGALVCPPDSFDVVDVKNPFMVGQQGKVNTGLAREQWLEVTRAFGRCGIDVRELPAVTGCEDMVFCANPAFSGLDSRGRRVCVLSHMRYPSRQPEVAAHAEWYRANGYRVVELPGDSLFEGSGDALWHPGRRLIWGGWGHRTAKGVYEIIAEIFGTPVVPVELKTELFYHLDTCFCPLDEETVLVYPPALTGEGMEMVRHAFPRVIEADRHEAEELMACNAAAFPGKNVVIQRGSVKVNQRLRELGFQVSEVSTSEFMKSGGSVFCMKMYLF
jgi:N-dimethylarginine dimethylaminohydrolase